MKARWGEMKGCSLASCHLTPPSALFLLDPSGSEVTVCHDRASATSPPGETEVTGTVLPALGALP